MRGLWHKMFGCPAKDVESTSFSIVCRCGAHWWRDEKSGQWVDHVERDYSDYRCVG